MGEQYDEFGEGRKHVSFQKKINVNRQDFKYSALFTFTFILGVMLKQILPSIRAFGFKIPLTIQGKQYFQLKCRVHERLIGFHKCWLAIAKLTPLSLFISPLSMLKKAFDNVRKRKLKVKVVSALQ